MSAYRPRAKAASGRTGPAPVTTRDGTRLLVEPGAELPLVDVVVTLCTGSAADPAEQAGLTRITARMIRMGTRKLRRHQVEEAIDALGAQLSVEIAPSFVRFRCVTLQRSVEPLFALLGELLREPAMRARDLSSIKRETIADIVELADHDRALASRGLRRLVLGDHPYGRPGLGTQRSVASITRRDVLAHYERHFVTRNMIVGAAGAITPEQLEHLVETHLGGMPRRRAPRVRLPVPRQARGRRLLIVDKPRRTQTQIRVGRLGTRLADPELVPVLVANTAFGGTFTSRLTHEVRSKRGWSYGASSSFSEERQRDLWSMWTFPAAKDAAACLSLQLELMERWIERGITQAETKFAKDFLMNSHVFDIDTAAKRLEHAVDAELFGLPSDFYLHFDRYVRRVSRAEANRALAATLSARDVGISLVATASEVREALRALPKLESVEVMPYSDLL